MNEERFEEKIHKHWGERFERRRARGRVWTGLFLLGLGALLLLRTANPVLFPGWFFSWPVLLIAIGLFSGLRHGFRGPFWAILIFIGGMNLAEQIDPTLNLDRFMWPLIFMGIGLIFILRPRRSGWRRWRHTCEGPSRTFAAEGEESPGVMDEGEDRRDFVDVTAVFGGIKKNVLSKTFKGGDIVSFMGGSEIDLTQADFSGRVKIDVTNIFGGTKLVVPSSWDVQSDVTAVFGGVDDKRKIGGVNLDHGKVLVLDGTCMFGGIEIRNY